VISRLRGQLIEQSIGRVVLDLGGVGFEVLVSAAAELPPVGHEVDLHTKLIVREDSLTVFGFNTHGERHVFDLLCSVSGVGPKSALAVLSSLDLASIENAIRHEDDAVFRRVSGIGPKTAKLICVSLASKMLSVVGSRPAAGESNKAENVVTALVGLGWKEAAAKSAIEVALHENPESSDASLLRGILREIGSKKTTLNNE
jgi:Holliday junction DNA helicase RuvA